MGCVRWRGFCNCRGCGPRIGGETEGGRQAVYICRRISNGSRRNAGIGARGAVEGGGVGGVEKEGVGVENVGGR